MCVWTPLSPEYFIFIVLCFACMVVPILAGCLSLYHQWCTCVCIWELLNQPPSPWVLNWPSFISLNYWNSFFFTILVMISYSELCIMFSVGNFTCSWPLYVKATAEKRPKSFFPRGQGLLFLVESKMRYLLKCLTNLWYVLLSQVI